MATPDFNEKFIIESDASGEALGAVLKQFQNGIEKTVKFASRKLNNAEKNYSTVEREILGIIFAIKAFEIYLFNEFGISEFMSPGIS